MVWVTALVSAGDDGMFANAVTVHERLMHHAPQSLGSEYVAVEEEYAVAHIGCAQPFNRRFHARLGGSHCPAHILDLCGVLDVALGKKRLGRNGQFDAFPPQKIGRTKGKISGHLQLRQAEVAQKFQQHGVALGPLLAPFLGLLLVLGIRQYPIDASLVACAVDLEVVGEHDFFVRGPQKDEGAGSAKAGGVEQIGTAFAAADHQQGIGTV